MQKNKKVLLFWTLNTSWVLQVLYYFLESVMCTLHTMHRQLMHLYRIH